jgi:CRISPR-associated protein Csx3
MIKLVLCGPPHSGKSCFKHGLITALKTRPNAPYPYPINACPDGEGSWFHQTAQLDLKLAQQERKKGQFSLEQVELYTAWVRDVNLPLTIVDVGGLISPENRSIMAATTHAVILSRDPEAFAPWRQLCRELEIQVIAEFHSDYDAIADEITLGTSPLIGPLTGTIHHLDRSLDASTRPTVQALANVILELISSHP